MTFLELAQAQLDRGFSIIPIDPTDKKKPWRGWGVDHASRESVHIEMWAKDCPSAGVGVVADENFAILDIDDVSRLGELTFGRTALKTYTVQSSEGKAHYYFRKNGFEMKNLVFGPIGSLRANKQYVVGAGSPHRKGGTYTVIDDGPVAVMHEGMYEDLVAAAKKYRTSRDGVSLEGEFRILNGRKIREGEGRNDDMVRLAGLLWDGQRSQEQMLEDLAFCCELRHDPSYPLERMEELVERVMTWEPYLGFDIADILPDELLNAVKVTVGSTPLWELLGHEWPDISAADLQTIEITPRKVLLVEGITPVLREEFLLQIVAWRGVGKTNWALALANTLAGGGDLLGFKTVEPVPVLFVDGELPADLLKTRFHTLIRAEARDRIKVVSPSLFPVERRRGLNLLSAEDRHHLFKSVERTGAKVVILDSQATLMEGDSLQTEFHAQRNKLLLDLRLKGLCVIETHHAGKSGSQRSLSRNDDLLDLQMVLKRQGEDEDQPGHAQFILSYAKNREPGLFDQGHVITLIDGKWLTRPSDDEQALKDVLLTGITTPRAIAKELGWHHEKVRRIMNRVSRANLAKFNGKVAHPTGT
jgi:hypothetical protein